MRRRLIAHVRWSSEVDASPQASSLCPCEVGPDSQSLNEAVATLNEAVATPRSVNLGSPEAAEGQSVPNRAPSEAGVFLQPNSLPGLSQIPAIDRSALLFVAVGADIPRYED